MPRAHVLARRLIQLASLFAALLIAGIAFAAGTVKWKQTTLDERENKSWMLEIEIYMARAPDVPHVPVKFEFEPVANYERAMVEGDKLVERTVPLVGQQSLIESVDIGFLDQGSGKIEKRTKFSFKVTRALGFEAGEYRVKLIDTRNGSQIGAVQTLKLQGKNEIIDRRPIVFTGENGKKKKDADMKKVSSDAGAENKDDQPAGSASKDDSDEGPPPSKAEDPNADDDEKGSDADEETVKKKPGGCGCRTAPASSGPLELIALLAGGLAIAGWRRRRS